MAFIDVLDAFGGDDLLNRAIEKVMCGCGGKCACHHPNPVVAATVIQNGQCICEAKNAAAEGKE